MNLAIDLNQDLCKVIQSYEAFYLLFNFNISIMSGLFISIKGVDYYFAASETKAIDFTGPINFFTKI